MDSASTSPLAGGASFPQVVPAAESPAVEHLEWHTEPVRLGVLGVNLAKSVAFLEVTELAKFSNGVPRQGGGVQARPGLDPFLTAGTAITAAMRLDDPNDAATTILWGVDATLQRGTSGVPAVLEGGFSGKPLSFTPWQAVQSGEPWVYIADSTKMRKASRTSPSLPIGLPKASQPVSVAAEAPLVTGIATFSATDGTQASAWTPFLGPDAKPEGGVSGVPVLYDASGVDPDGCVNMATVEGSATTGYLCGMSIPRPLDLTLVGGQPSTDDDIISFALRINTPREVKEVRLYFVCGPFTDGAVPGGEPTKIYPTSANGNAYVRALRSSDYSEFIGAQGTGLEAASNVRSADLLTGFNDPATLAAATVSSASLAGSDTWTQYGSITVAANPTDPALHIPLRKSDFLRIGTAGQPGTDWSTITGIVIVVITKAAVPVTLGFDNAYLTGGKNPDTSEPDSQPYDYRIVNIDKRTGAQSNPSDEMATTLRIEALRQAVDIQPVPFGDANVYQEAYRRGGALNDNWYLAADNKATGDGTLITDNTSDITALTSGTLEVDNDQPVTTADETGAAVYNAPLSFIFGPLDGFLLGGGDKYRPGDVYWCKRSTPDSWPAANHTPCCPPSEQLLNGVMYASQAFVFSTQRMYAVQVNLSDTGQLTTAPTDCAEGLAGRMAFAVGPGGIFFVSRDALRVTQGGTSKVLSDNIRPLFRGETVNGYYPIDFTAPDQIRVTIHGDDVFFTFRDSQGSQVWWVFSLIYNTWRYISFGTLITLAYSDGKLGQALRLILGGLTSGKAYNHAGTTDDGVPFGVLLRTGAMFATSREEKLLGDIEVWGKLLGAEVTLQPWLNNEVTADLLSVGTAPSTYARMMFHPFGNVPQHAQSISVELGWTVPDESDITYVDMLGISVAIQPEITMRRATTWQALNNPGESYVQGCWVDCDSFGADITVVVEGLLNGASITLATLTINSDAGRKQWFSWPAQHTDMIRLRPSENCEPWMLFGQGWMTRPEPPRVSGLDSGFENLSDTYYTGLDLEIDTFGVDKQIVVEVDGAVVEDSATSLGYFTVNTPGRRLVHLTLPGGRGHVYRFYSTDSPLALLYTHKWWVAAEPSEQSNWNQNFTIAGTHADKWLKGILLECDTFGVEKEINVEVDGIPVPSGTFTVNTTGRKVVQISFPQVLGRVFRIWPADHFPGRLYSAGWLFDEEPYQLTRFETQELPVGIDAWKMATYGQITYKSNGAVSLTCLVYGQTGQVIASDTYTLPSTAGVKGMTPWKPHARKGALYKFVVTEGEGFWLYREESWIRFQSWTGGGTLIVRPFGNDDLDQTRNMVDAGRAALRSGGAA